MCVCVCGGGGGWGGVKRYVKATTEMPCWGRRISTKPREISKKCQMLFKGGIRMKGRRH